MKVGHTSAPEPLARTYANQFDDLLKLWIWLDGTRVIYDQAVGRSDGDVPAVSSHHSALCGQIYQDPRLRSAILDLLAEHAESIVFRAIVKARLSGRIDTIGGSSGSQSQV
jgi:hypothetical protein